MIRKPVAIIVGLILLLGGLFKCDAFSAEGTPLSENQVMTRTASISMSASVR